MIKAVLFDFGGTLVDRDPTLGKEVQDQEYRKVPHVESALNELSLEFKLAVVSNTMTWRERDIRYALRIMGLEDYFDAVITSVDVGFFKPEAEIFEEVLRRLEVEAHECIMVGDRPDVDMLGGNRLGMKTVHILHHQEEITYPEPQKPDYVIHSLKELQALVHKVSR